MTNYLNSVGKITKKLSPLKLSRSIKKNIFKKANKLKTINLRKKMSKKMFPTRKSKRKSKRKPKKKTSKKRMKGGS
jgi:hypothetical protein|tara:strand:- start:6059 stop:6286 length:228 start_codon:yes stop_codon:yes gene_type:complete